MPVAYYNENDPYAAAWLRDLIAAGHIAYGVVDERSIQDVRPSDLAGFTQCHFFAGIGVWSYALRLAGCGDDEPVWTGSCPCQPFSDAGKGAGFDDERHLWPYWHHLIRVCRPRLVFGEQVASKDGLAWLDLVYSDMEGEAYAMWARDICAAGVGAPHIRQRLWFVGSELANADSQSRGLSEHAGRSHNVEAIGRGECAEASERRAAGFCESTGRGAISLVGDADSRRREQTGRTVTDYVEATTGREASRHSGSGAPSPVELEHAARDGREQGLADSGRRGEGISTQRQFGRPTESEHASELANSDEGQRGRLANGEGCECDGSSTGWEQSNRQLESSGVVRSYWSDAEWIACRDGKWRAVESGTFPLAHGDFARVGRLRAYGNAICAEVAAEFIAAYFGAVADSTAAPAVLGPPPY